jgi:inositol-hexakisphosphate/diphosphoinositol-pentakisphosphate 1-kinase
VGSEEEKQVVVGICAMGKKSQSKPMKEILTRLEEFEYLKMLVFPEETILKVSNSKTLFCSLKK